MKRLIAIVLVSPENPDNIGAVARAMKNMGLADLRLVKPPKAWKRKGRKMAMSARDVLEAAQDFKTLEDALSDIQVVVGTTRRRGPRRGAFVDYQKGIDQIKQNARHQRTAILFGKESKGLDNVSLSRCDWVLSIPSDSAYPSLNLAQAVMVTAFSLYEEKAAAAPPSKPLRFCEKSELEGAMEHFRMALIALDYDKGERLVERILTTLRGVFKRNGMLESEAQMLKGLSRTIRMKLKKAEEKAQKDDKIPCI
jgi:tRNA/rRNA methyltransferase